MLKRNNNMETNNRFTVIENIDASILLEEGLDADFAKNVLSKCNTKEINRRDVIIINKDGIYVVHKTDLEIITFYPSEMKLCNEDGEQIMMADNTVLIRNFNDLDLENRRYDKD
jgi:hypothetical protein